MTFDKKQNRIGFAPHSVLLPLKNPPLMLASQIIILVATSISLFSLIYIKSAALSILKSFEGNTLARDTTDQLKKRGSKIKVMDRPSLSI